jgi:hypothetical protein
LLLALCSLLFRASVGNHDVDVNVPVAGVTKRRDRKPALLLDVLDEREELRVSGRVGRRRRCSA